MAERNEVNEVERSRMTIAVAASSPSSGMRALRTSLIVLVFQKRQVVVEVVEEEDRQIAWTAFGGGSTVAANSFMNGDGDWGCDCGSDSGNVNVTGNGTDTGVTCNRESDLLDGNVDADWDWDARSLGGVTASCRGRGRG